jgi:hypothetical protein
VKRKMVRMHGTWSVLRTKQETLTLLRQLQRRVRVTKQRYWLIRFNVGVVTPETLKLLAKYGDVRPYNRTLDVGRAIEFTKVESIYRKISGEARKGKAKGKRVRDRRRKRTG